MLKENDYDYVKRACARECKTIEDAEDLTSIIVIKLLTLNKDISKPYRNRLIRNTIINYYTRGPKLNEVPAEILPENTFCLQPCIDRREQYERLHKSTWKLPKKQRDVIQDVLRYRSYKEISKDRDMSYNAVTTNYSHGLKTLRFLLTRKAKYDIL